MSIECAVFSIGVLIQVTAFRAWYQIMIGRFISGLGVGALSAAVPLYQAECAPKQLRGTLTGTYQRMYMLLCLRNSRLRQTIQFSSHSVSLWLTVSVLVRVKLTTRPHGGL
jgi:hypothetical protein